jgi:hypothetical protein
MAPFAEKEDLKENSMEGNMACYLRTFEFEGPLEDPDKDSECAAS